MNYAIKKYLLAGLTMCLMLFTLIPNVHAMSVVKSFNMIIIQFLDIIRIIMIIIMQIFQIMPFI